MLGASAFSSAPFSGSEYTDYSGSVLEAIGVIEATAALMIFTVGAHDAVCCQAITYGKSSYRSTRLSATAHLAEMQHATLETAAWKRLKPTIISQYANSPIMMELMHNWSESIDATANLDNFYNHVFNIKTAAGYGLDVWGRIVNVPRTLKIAGGRKFGYVVDSGLQDWDPYNQQQFYYGTTTTENYFLSDEAYRTLIMAKAFSNIRNSTIQTYNRLLMMLFPKRGNAYVHDTGNMLFEIIFNFIVQPFEIAIIEDSGVFMGPTGVGFTWQIILPDTFGFKGVGATIEPFNNGIFFTGH